MVFSSSHVPSTFLISLVLSVAGRSRSCRPHPTSSTSASASNSLSRSSLSLQGVNRSIDHVWHLGDHRRQATDGARRMLHANCWKRSWFYRPRGIAAWSSSRVPSIGHRYGENFLLLWGKQQQQQQQKNAAVVHCSILRSYKKMRWSLLCIGLDPFILFLSFVSHLFYLYLSPAYSFSLLPLFYKLFFDAQLMSLSIWLVEKWRYNSSGKGALHPEKWRNLGTKTKGYEDFCWW